MAESVKWSNDAKRDFAGWFHRQLFNTIGDRGALDQKWADEIVQVRARVIGDGTSDVPFVGAADLPFPLTSMHVDPTYSDFMQTLHVPQDFWSIVGKRPDTVGVAGPVQEFLSTVERNHIGMRAVNERAILDLVVHGTAIYKDRIHHGRRDQRRQTKAGGTLRVPLVEFGPRVEHVPLPDFFIPARSRNIDPDAPVGGAPWVAQRFYRTQSELRAASVGEAPFAPVYDKDATEIVLKLELNKQTDRVDEQRQREDRYIPFENRRIELYEVWARFDVDGDGFDEDVTVIWHQNASQVLRATYNPFQHGKRPFEAATYFPGFGFYGIGLAEMDEWAQLASERVLNDVLNNAHLANAIMLGVPAGTNVKPDEAIYSGKIWRLAPEEQIQAIQLGRPYPAMTELLGMFGQWAEQRTGMSELRQGDVSQIPSRTPAATVMSALSEGKKRFDMVMGNLREGPLARIGCRVLQNLVQISQSDPRWKLMAQAALGPEDAEVVVGILSGEVPEVEDQFGFAVTATSSQVNKEVMKQSLTLLGQLMAQLYQQQFQWAQMQMQLTKDPTPIAAVVTAALSGTSELQRRVLEAHDIQNPDQYTPKLAPAGGGMGAPGMAPPAPPGAAPAGPAGAPPPTAAPGPLGPLDPMGGEILPLLGVR